LGDLRGCGAATSAGVGAVLTKCLTKQAYIG
jgi:hypothetical protein